MTQRQFLDKNKDVNLILFDIGGLFVKLSGLPKLIKWTGLSIGEISKKWLYDENVIVYETGKRSDLEFAKQLIIDWNIPLTPERLIVEFRSWANSLNTGAIELLTQIKEQTKIACLTNTNPIQWPFIKNDLGLGQYFHYHFASHEIGLMKPDKNIFKFVEMKTGISKKNMIFFDDSIDNVESARQFGIKSHYVKNLTQIKELLAEYHFQIKA